MDVHGLGEGRCRIGGEDNQCARLRTFWKGGARLLRLAMVVQARPARYMLCSCPCILTRLGDWR